MIRKFIFDEDRYMVYLDNAKVKGCYFEAGENGRIDIVDRRSSAQSSMMLSDKNTLKFLSKCKLAGGIFILPIYKAIKSVSPSRLFEAKYDYNIVHIDYDGITHLVIEDDDYIYTHDIPTLIDINVQYDDSIFLIRYHYEGLEHIIVVEKAVDYIEHIIDEGDEIVITDEGVDVIRHFDDILGRTRTRTYTFDDGKYIANTKFSYTYNEVIDDITMPLLEDAIYARDYGYVDDMLSERAGIDTISNYFFSILGDDFDILKAEPISSDTMHFLVNDGVASHIERIVVTMDNGKIVNFDRGIDG